MLGTPWAMSLYLGDEDWSFYHNACHLFVSVNFEIEVGKFFGVSIASRYTRHVTRVTDLTLDEMSPLSRPLEP